MRRAAATARRTPWRGFAPVGGLPRCGPSRPESRRVRGWLRRLPRDRRSPPPWPAIGFGIEEGEVEAAALPRGDQRIERGEGGAKAQFDFVFHAGLAPERVISTVD